MNIYNLINRDQIPTMKVVGIDPGSHLTGIAILSLDILTFSFVDLKAFTIVTEDHNQRYQSLEQCFSPLTTRVWGLRDRLIELFRMEQPSIIACEQPFFNPRFPSAYAPLVKTISSIEQAVVEYHPYVGIHYISPKEIKKAVSSGVADKAAVSLGVQNFKPFDLNALDLNGLDNNALDAIAITAFIYNDLIRTKQNYA